VYAVFRDVPAMAVCVPSVLGGALHCRNLPFVVLSRFIKLLSISKLRDLSINGALDVLLIVHQSRLFGLVMTIGGDDCCALSHSRLQFTYSRDEKVSSSSPLPF